MKREAWISDTSNKRVRQIKQSFQQALAEQAKEMRINYYDFLLVAKKLAFRFEESSHLMALKNFFSKNKNSVLTKKLVDVLTVNQESLNSRDDKIIVKFNVPDNDFAPIKEVTCEDEEENLEDQEEDVPGEFTQMGSIPLDQNQQVNEKMSIILSIKMEEMQKKIKLLTNQFHYPNVFTVFNDVADDRIDYELFRARILVVITDLRDKIKISEDDIKTLFHVLEEEQAGSITLQDLDKLKNIDNIAEKMKNFYFSRINRDMVKNTLFKLGRVKSSSIQIYQLKNASVLEFQQIEDQIVNEPIQRPPQVKKRIPHFGPLKGAKQKNKIQKHYSTDIKYPPNSSANLAGKKQIDKERQRIQKILRYSKEEKKKGKQGDTVASKLRSLFIHKVILPREKMLEQQKLKYGRTKMGDHQLAIRPLKDTR